MSNFFKRFLICLMLAATVLSAVPAEVVAI